jgi:hypothetical protein
MALTRHRDHFTETMDLHASSFATGAAARDVVSQIGLGAASLLPIASHIISHKRAHFNMVVLSEGTEPLHNLAA